MNITKRKKNINNKHGNIKNENMDIKQIGSGKVESTQPVDKKSDKKIGKKPGKKSVEKTVENPDEDAKKLIENENSASLVKKIESLLDNSKKFENTLTDPENSKILGIAKELSNSATKSLKLAEKLAQKKTENIVNKHAKEKEAVNKLTKKNKAIEGVAEVIKDLITKIEKILKTLSEKPSIIQGNRVKILTTINDLNILGDFNKNLYSILKGHFPNKSKFNQLLYSKIVNGEYNNNNWISKKVKNKIISSLSGNTTNNQKNNNLSNIDSDKLNDSIKLIIEKILIKIKTYNEPNNDIDIVSYINKFNILGEFNKKLYSTLNDYINKNNNNKKFNQLIYSKIMNNKYNVEKWPTKNQKEDIIKSLNIK